MVVATDRAELAAGLAAVAVGETAAASGVVVGTARPGARVAFLFAGQGTRAVAMGAGLAVHSVGEIAVAHVAGMLSLADAAALVTARARLRAALPGGGAMVSVQASEDEVLALIGDRPDVAVAAVNGPRPVVLSGAEEAVFAVAAAVAALGRRTRRSRSRTPSTHR